MCVSVDFSPSLVSMPEAVALWRAGHFQEATQNLNVPSDCSETVRLKVCRQSIEMQSKPAAVTSVANRGPCQIAANQSLAGFCSGQVSSEQLLSDLQRIQVESLRFIASKVQAV